MIKTTASLFLVTLFFISCSTHQQEATSPSTAFINATIINSADPVSDAVLVIQNGSIVAIGPKEKTIIPTNATVIDLKGKYIIPGLINAHGHVTNVSGLERYARYGITTMVSLGGEPKGLEQWRDINDSTNTTHARLYMAGKVITNIADIDSNKNMGVDWMKIRVDDNLGSSTKMTEDVYTAVIKKSHDNGYKIATHMYYLDDAKKLLSAGSDLMAHSVRDKAIDDEFATLIQQRNVCYCPTLTRELSTFVYETTPAFFNDPFFTREYDSTSIAPLLDRTRQEEIRKSKSAQTYKQQLHVAMANLKKLSDLGIPIAMGTDSGIPSRFVGYFEHVEMAMMAEAGLSPVQILKSATKDAAQCMGLKNVGELKPGYKADFVVLDANPLEDIKNTRKINSVYISGQSVKR